MYATWLASIRRLIFTTAFQSFHLALKVVFRRQEHHRDMRQVDILATMAEYVMEEESAFTPTADGYSLLFVEDNDEMRDFLSEQLSKCGATTSFGSCRMCRPLIRH